MMPPSAKEGHTSATILLCLAWQSDTFSTDHCSTAPLSFLNMPSPEHGTSAIIISKKPGRDEKAAGSALVTITFGSPHNATLSARTPALVFMTSLDTSRNESPNTLRNDAARSVVFPPGAAHRSRTLKGLDAGLISTLDRHSRTVCPTNIDEESCT